MLFLKMDYSDKLCEKGRGDSIYDGTISLVLSLAFSFFSWL